jgi:hypothetical protein
MQVMKMLCGTWTFKGHLMGPIGMNNWRPGTDDFAALVANLALEDLTAAAAIQADPVITQLAQVSNG